MIKYIMHDSERMQNTFETLHRLQVVFEVSRGDVRQSYMTVRTGVPADMFAKALREWADSIDKAYDIPIAAEDARKFAPVPPVETMMLMSAGGRNG